MKKTSGYLPFIGISGLALLAGSFILFDFPFFGLCILALMTGLFGFSVFKYFHHLKEVEAEMLQMERLENEAKYFEAAEGTQLHDRIRQLRRMHSEGRKVDPQVFSNILSARESARVALPGGNTLVVLGLLGTFYGLIQVVSEAGGLIEGGNLSAIDSVVDVLFRDMRGIFGTTLFGLAASMLLNVAQQIWQRSQMRFMARMEEFTQLHLLPAYSVEEEHPVLPALHALKGEIVGLRAQLGGDWGSLVESQLKTLSTHLQEVGEKAQVSLKDSVEQSSSAVAELQKALLESTRESGALLKDELQKALANFSEAQAGVQKEIKEQISHSIAAQGDHMKSWIETGSQQNSILVENYLDAAKGILEETRRETQEGIKALSNSLTELTPALNEMKEKLSASVESFFTEANANNKEWVQELQGQSQNLLSALQENSKTIQDTVQNELSNKLLTITQSFADVGEMAKANLGAGSEQLKAMQEQISAVTGQLGELTGNLADAGRLMKVNQAELQSVMEMFTQGVQNLIESFGDDQVEEEAKDNLFDQIEKVLSNFQERSNDILQENALKTQEILMEVLQRVSAVDGGGK